MDLFRPELEASIELALASASLAASPSSTAGQRALGIANKVAFSIFVFKYYLHLTMFMFLQDVARWQKVLLCLANVLPGYVSKRVPHRVKRFEKQKLSYL